MKQMFQYSPTALLAVVLTIFSTTQQSLSEETARAVAGESTKQSGKKQKVGDSNNLKKKEAKMNNDTLTVIMETSAGGPIEIELNAKAAPETVKNFLNYVDKDFYNGTIFHRVIDNFMVQGGGFTADMKQKSTEEQIKNEAKNGLKNDKYTLAMARTPVVDSATAQFFINVADNSFLNHNPSGGDAGYGYAVFGKVTSGMDVVDKIKKAATKTMGGHENVPVETIVIKSIKRK